MTAPYFKYFASDNSVEVGPNLRLTNLPPTQGGRFATTLTVTSGFGGVATVPATILWSRLGNVVQCEFALNDQPQANVGLNFGNFLLPVARATPFSASVPILTQQAMGPATYGGGATAGIVTGMAGTTNRALLEFTNHPGNDGAVAMATFSYFIE